MQGRRRGEHTSPIEFKVARRVEHQRTPIAAHTCCRTRTQGANERASQGARTSVAASPAR
eukprot:2531479-Alexandrium_andersonii.AAC.1